MKMTKELAERTLDIKLEGATLVDFHYKSGEETDLEQGRILWKRSKPTFPNKPYGFHTARFYEEHNGICQHTSLISGVYDVTLEEAMAIQR